MTAAARRPTVPGRSAGKNDKFRRRLRSVDVDTFIVRGPVPVLASGVAGPRNCDDQLGEFRRSLKTFCLLRDSRAARALVTL